MESRLQLKIAQVEYIYLLGNGFFSLRRPPISLKKQHQQPYISTYRYSTVRHQGFCVVLYCNDRGPVSFRTVPTCTDTVSLFANAVCGGMPTATDEEKETVLGNCHHQHWTGAVRL
jgi:hypothetical protein